MKGIKALESGPLERLFNGNVTAKMLDFLIAFQEWDYSESDIARNSGVSLRSAQREIPKLERYSLVKNTRVVGRAKMYQLVEGATVEKLALELAGKDARKHLPKEIIRARG